VPYRLNITVGAGDGFSLRLSNDSGENMTLGYDKNAAQYFIDRTHSGAIDFQKNFAARHSMPRLTQIPTIHLSIFVDESSVELFADDGLSVMTSICFPSAGYNHVELQSQQLGALFTKIQFIEMKSIW